MCLRRVLKFGGSSVGLPKRIAQVVAMVTDSERYQAGSVVGVVVSAFQGITDSLIQLAEEACLAEREIQCGVKKIEERHIEALRQLLPPVQLSAPIAAVKVLCNELSDLLHGVSLVRECTPRTLEQVMSFGERLSAVVVAEAFSHTGYEAEVLDSRRVVVTDDLFGRARVDRDETTNRIRTFFAEPRPLQIITGFVGSTREGVTTTLGRGGSDLTAAIFGAALGVDEIEIWTDVDGMLTADPRRVPKAFVIPKVTFQEAMELCHFGAKVIYPPTIQPAVDARIPILIKNTLNPATPGTRIVGHPVENGEPITGISSISSVVLLRLEGSGMVGVSGTAARFFKALAQADINVILITQASSEHTICCAIDPRHTERARRAVAQEFALEMKAGLIDPLTSEEELSIVSVVGERMRSSPGMAGRVFAALGSNGANVVAIAQGSSELNISAVIPAKEESKALNALHDEFFLTQSKTVNLWIVGTGLIGATLLAQIGEQRELLREESGIDLHIRGVANSREMLCAGSSDASLPCSVDGALGGEPFSLEAFRSHILDANLPNSIFVDCTASDNVPTIYPRLLERSIVVVTTNKRAFSGSLAHYEEIYRASRIRRTPVLHETCVGAALPILGTLRDLVRSGDQVLSIEAVLSGTLSFIFNSMADGEPFSAAVREAKVRGYTEPDPRDDLSGMDVARKLLILARDAGVRLELSDLEIEPLLPAEVASWSKDEFLVRLDTLDPHFKAKIDEARAEGKRLFFSASLDCLHGVARMGLRALDTYHPFWSLRGADNIVAFTTKRYASRPLVVKGPGAGAEVTAAGVFADIIRAAR